MSSIDPKNTENIEIFVLGDVNLDTLLAPLPGEMNWWRLRQQGGVWLLEEIIRAALKAVNDAASHKVMAKRAEVQTYTKTGPDSDFLNSEAILGLFPKLAKRSPGDTEKVYRVDRLLGWVHNDKDPIIRGQKEVYKKSLVNCLMLHKSA